MGGIKNLTLGQTKSYTLLSTIKKNTALDVTDASRDEIGVAFWIAGRPGCTITARDLTFRSRGHGEWTIDGQAGVLYHDQAADAAYEAVR